MEIRENIFEGLRSIRSNLLRSVLTAVIITFGIMALVGILTTIEGMQSSVNKSFEGLGANSFDIKIEQNNNRRFRGMFQKQQKPLTFRQALEFKNLFSAKYDADVSIYTYVNQDGVLKYNGFKTNPTSVITGVDENFIGLRGFKISKGRNISNIDRKYSNHVTVLGNELAYKIFSKEDPLNKVVSINNEKYTVIGVLSKKGSINGGGDDRIAMIPIETARNYDNDGKFTYEISTSVKGNYSFDYVIGEATSIMRMIRRDKLYDKESFKIEKSDALLKDFNDVTGYLRIGGFAISFITLLGACIALMNIMMVSVTERTREIGVRKALGATPTKIRQQFLIEAIVICVIGGVAGIIFGITAGNVVSKLMSPDNAFVVPWNWILLGFTVCIIVGLISGYYPAYKASKFDPIESLRYE